MSIPIVFGIDKTIANIVQVPMNKIEHTLQTNTNAYEITWSESDSQMCRAYMDIDGVMGEDTDAYDFEVMNDAIQRVLMGIDLGTPFSLMTASKHANKDWKDGTTKHKLSYRITFTHKAGSKDAVKEWVRDTICPILKSELASIIPFYVKGTDTIPEHILDYLDWDNGVYRTNGKMRCWNSTKPREDRLNVILKGTWEDTLINYIPEGCEEIKSSAPQNIVCIAEEREAVEAPVLTADNALLLRVMDALPASVANDYTMWLSVGMACFKENIPLEAWDEWSQRSSKYRAGECERKWRTFKRSNITQSYLWALLKRTNSSAFIELNDERRDFIHVLHNGTSYVLAEYFFNHYPNDYLYDANAGWFAVNPSNIWENPKAKATPPTLMLRITRQFRADCLAYEARIVRMKTLINDDPAKSDEDKTTAMDALEPELKRVRALCKHMQSNMGVSGIISFLSAFYAEQTYELIASMGTSIVSGIMDIFDSNPNLFAFKDCLYDFTTKSFRPISATDYITMTCGYNRPTPNATVRAQIMETMLGIWEDQSTADYMLTLLASCLCGVRNAEVFTIMTGRGGNGKGLLWELVQNVFGAYYYNLPVANLTKKIDSSTAATPDIANLRGKRCVGTSEPEANEHLQEGTVKLLTGGDALTARLLYGQPITFKPQFALFIQCNVIPVFNQITKGGVRRNRVVPFPFNFVGEPTLSYERRGNPHIKNVLCKSTEWRDEFFNILLDYFPRAEGKQIDQIATPKMVADRTGEYIEDNNRVGVWWIANYEVAEDEIVSSKEAFEAYRHATGARLTDRDFKAALAFNDIDVKKITKRGDMKGKCGIENWRRKENTEDNEIVNP